MLEKKYRGRMSSSFLKINVSFNHKIFSFFQLCFKKGDIITITQVDDEGWWEGTLHDKTGWFPSNYVKEYRIPGTENFLNMFE